MPSDSDYNPLHAVDTLNVALQTLRYVINNRTREDDPGEGWTLGFVEDRIQEALVALRPWGEGTPCSK